MLELLLKKLNDEAKIPEKAHKTDAGFDLFSVEDTVILSGEYKLIKTGISIQLPPSTEAQIRSKSGMALKFGITVLNSPGTIDEEYRGEIGVILINHGKSDFHVEKHMKIAQMVVTPVMQVELKEIDVLTDTGRGAGGFGSTGTK